MAPTPAPAAVASLAPTPAPVQTSCERIGLGPGTGTGCPRENATFQKEVDEAIFKLVRERPEIFDGTRVKSLGQYVVGVIDNLEAAGLCADYDGEELQVKNSNDFNDQYDILTSSFLYRWGPGSYRSTCYPAAFPTSPPPQGQTPGCSLKASKEKACGREKPSFLAQLDAAIEKVADEHPEILDKTSVRGSPGSYQILNFDAYVDQVVRNLSARGLCAHYDGEELAVKNENGFSDQYDIILSDGYIRRGEGSYRTTCYPAAF
jgi:hypothetical protein